MRKKHVLFIIIIHIVLNFMFCSESGVDHTKYYVEYKGYFTVIDTSYTDFRVEREWRLEVDVFDENDVFINSAFAPVDSNCVINNVVSIGDTVKCIYKELTQKSNPDRYASVAARPSFQLEVTDTTLERCFFQ